MYRDSFEECQWDKWEQWVRNQITIMPGGGGEWGGGGCLGGGFASSEGRARRGEG